MNNKVNDNLAILNYIYQASDMAIAQIENLSSKVESKELEDTIDKQKLKFKNIMNESLEVFIKYGKDEKEISGLTKMTGKMMIDLKTLKDTSTINLVTILLEATDKAITHLKLEYDKNLVSDKEIEHLYQELLKALENNSKELKGYL